MDWDLGSCSTSSVLFDYLRHGMRCIGLLFCCCRVPLMSSVRYPMQSFYNLAQSRSSGPSGSEVTLVDFPAGSRMSGGAETARACSCDGHDLARGPNAGPSRLRIVIRSYYTPSLPFEGGDIVYACAERPTIYREASSSTSPDTSSLSDMPSCEVGVIHDVVADVPGYRCSR